MWGRIFRAIGAEGIGQLLNVAIRLLLVPLFLAAWGTQTYGEWLILTAVAGLFSLADMGAQMYFVNRMTEAWVQRKLNEFKDIFSTGIFFFGITSFTLMALATVVLMHPGIPNWLGIESTDSNIVYWVLIIMCLRVLASLPLGLLLGVYRATGAQATSVMYGNLMLIIQLIVSVVVLSTGGSMILMALSEVIGMFLVSFWVIFGLRSHIPAEVRLFRLHRPQMGILQQAWSPSLHFLAIQLAMAVMIQGSIIVVAKAMGPFEVVIFSTMRTIANVVSRFLAMISHSAWPEFTRLYIDNDSKRLQILFQSILFVSTLTGLLYLGVVQFFGSKIFDLWVGGRLPYETWVMLMMALLVVLTNQWTLGGNLLMATNTHVEYAQVQLPVNITALGISYLGAGWFGLEGFIGALILGQSVPMIIFTVRSFRRNFWWDASRSVTLQTLLVLMLLPLYLHPWGVILIVVGVLLFGVYALRGKIQKLSS
jgi:O-antigen/teichoic acid export membrane protein